MVNLARQLVSHNQLTGRINVYQKRSDELTVLHGRSEQSDSSALSAQAPTATGQQQAPEHQSEQSPQECASTPTMSRNHSRLHTPGVKPPDRPDMPRKADVIVTEIFDSELLGEGILPTMQHAVKHLLQVCHQFIHLHLAFHIAVTLCSYCCYSYAIIQPHLTLYMGNQGQVLQQKCMSFQNCVSVYHDQKGTRIGCSQDNSVCHACSHT